MPNEVKKIIDKKHSAWCSVTGKLILKHAQNRCRESNIDTLRFIEQLDIGKMKGSDQWFISANMRIAKKKTDVLKNFTTHSNLELFG